MCFDSPIAISEESHSLYQPERGGKDTRGTQSAPPPPPQAACSPRGCVCTRTIREVCGQAGEVTLEGGKALLAHTQTRRARHSSGEPAIRTERRVPTTRRLGGRRRSHVRTPAGSSTDLSFQLVLDAHLPPPESNIDGGQCGRDDPRADARLGELGAPDRRRPPCLREEDVREDGERRAQRQADHQRSEGRVGRGVRYHAGASRGTDPAEYESNRGRVQVAAGGRSPRAEATSQAQWGTEATDRLGQTKRYEVVRGAHSSVRRVCVVSPAASSSPSFCCDAHVKSLLDASA